MECKIHAESLEWKDDPDRKPMILLGCRQVGKTFIVMEFGDREYENIAYNQHYIERILNNPKTPKCNREAAIKFVKDHPDGLLHTGTHRHTIRGPQQAQFHN